MGSKNEVLQAEMSEHLQAGRHERTSERKGYRHGSCTRQLTTRVETLRLGVRRDRKGIFRTELFERYQRRKRSSRL